MEWEWKFHWNSIFYGGMEHCAMSPCLRTATAPPYTIHTLYILVHIKWDCAVYCHFIEGGRTLTTHVFDCLLSRPVFYHRAYAAEGCGQWSPDMVQCYNMGSDGHDAAWKCEASMMEGYSFSFVEVNFHISNIILQQQVLLRCIGSV